MNPAAKAIMLLNKLGYRAWVEGESVKLSFTGQGEPDPSQVIPLLEAVKAHKTEVRQLLAGRQASPPERIPLCQDCPWYELNPWTHYPDLGAWCAYHMDYLLTENPQCRDFRRREIPQQRLPETG